MWKIAKARMEDHNDPQRLDVAKGCLTYRIQEVAGGVPQHVMHRVIDMIVRRNDVDELVDILDPRTRKDFVDTVVQALQLCEAYRHADAAADAYDLVRPTPGARQLRAAQIRRFLAEARGGPGGTGRRR